MLFRLCCDRMELFSWLLVSGFQLALQARHIVQGILQAINCLLLGLKMPACFLPQSSQLRLCLHSLQMLLRSIFSCRELVLFSQQLLPCLPACLPPQAEP